MIRFMEGRFRGRDVLIEPKCPFCGDKLGRPTEIKGIASKGMPVGVCGCGAVFAFDATGHNLGTAMSEALVHSCSGDWERAWDLLPEKDYFQALIENYDLDTNLVIPSGIHEGRRIAGALYFILLKTKGPEARKDNASTANVPPISERRHSSGRAKRSYRKDELERLVEDYRVESILDLARQDSRILRDIRRLLYSVDTLKRMRAAEIMGMALSIVAEREPDAATTVVQNLFSSLTDTAASGWGSIAAIGEIIKSSPERFGSFIPQLLMLSGERTFLSDIMDALRKISAVKPDLLRRYAFQLIPMLKHEQPDIRGLTALILGHISATEAADDLRAVLSDQAEMEIYSGGVMQKTTVGLLAAEALGML
jgi:hypothetical protein